MSAPQPPQPPGDDPIGDAADRTQVVRPAQSPQGPHAGGFNPGRPQQGGFSPGGPQQGGFSPGGPQQGGFSPGGQQAGGFNPGGPPGGFQPGGPGPSGPPPGGFNPGGAGGGFGPPNGPPAGFGGAGENPGDKTVALSAAGSAALIGLIVIIVNLSTIGYIFDVSTGIGFLVIVALVVAAGLIAGGVLIYLKNPIGPYVAGGCAAFVLLIGLINLIGAFTGGGVVVLILVAIPAVLAFLPQTARYVKTANAGFGRHQRPPGRPF